MRNIRDTRVAVIGGAGFLGSHLVNYLIDDRNCDVLVIDNLVAGRREFIHPKATFEHHDITGSEDRLRQLFVEFGAKYVFNYAAYPYIPISFVRPIHVNDVNFMGAMKVINAAQEAGAEAILQVSSAEIFGDSGARQDGTVCRAHKKVDDRMFYCGLDAFHVGIPHSSGCGKWEDDRFFRIDETCPANPHSSYGVAKAAVDNWVQVRWREAETPCIALRQFNCLGERETHPYIVPEIISQLAKQVCDACDGAGTISNQWAKESWLRGGGGNKEPSYNGGYIYYNKAGQELPFKTVVGYCEECKGVAVSQVKLGNNSFRDFLYAGDAVRIAVELLERGEFGEVYNLGSETGIKMFSLAEMIGRLMGFNQVKIEVDPNRVRPWEIWHLQSCNDKIYQAIRHKHPLTSLEDSLKKTIAWYESNNRKWCWES